MVKDSISYSLSHHVADSFSSLLTALREKQRLLLLSHVRPDGDALGSLLGMGLWLQEQRHQVTLWNEDGMSQRYDFLPGSELVQKTEKLSGEELITRFDAILILDTATRERLGKETAALLQQENRPPLYAIDHHLSNTHFADLTYLEAHTPATCQIVARELLAQEKISGRLSAEMATNLFVGISTDTGSFQYQGTTAETLEVAAALVARGVDVGELSMQLYHSQPRRRFVLLKEVFAQTEFLEGGKLATFFLRRSLVESLGVEREDMEGLIDQFRSVEGVRVALFMEELSSERLRISVRSKDLGWDASAFCQKYGGGGHQLAAGAVLEGPVEESAQRVLETIRQDL